MSSYEDWRSIHDQMIVDDSQLSQENLRKLAAFKEAMRSEEEAAEEEATYVFGLWQKICRQRAKGNVRSSASEKLIEDLLTSIQDYRVAASVIDRARAWGVRGSNRRMLGVLRSRHKFLVRRHTEQAEELAYA